MKRSLRLAPAAGVLLLTFPLVLTGLALAADWPQLGGPDRDFRVEAPGLATEWPAEGPRELWRRPLGLGYSPITVVDDRLYTMYREGENEVVIAASAATGETLWQHTYAAPFAEYMRMEHGSGPHVAPLVVGNRVFTVGIRGRLLALDRTSGEILWSRELLDEMGGTELNRGYANSPLALGSTIVLPIGGEGRGIAAFDQASGEVVWQANDFENSYSSPILIDVDGQEQLLFFGRDRVYGMNPDGGEIYWSHDHETSYGLNISVPLWNPDDQLLFLSSAYNGGSRVLRLSQSDGKTEVEELWAHKQMRVHISNAMRIGDVVWGANGDFGPVPFTAVDIDDGEILYRTRDFPRPNLVLADGKLILLDEDGELALVTPKRDDLEVHARHQLFDARAWTAPTLVGTTLYARDTEEMVALELPTGHAE
jgi:outer membrane protein assembly factor BamB